MPNKAPISDEFHAVVLDRKTYRKCRIILIFMDIAIDIDRVFSGM